MPRTRPIKRIGVYCGYDINPEDAVGFYIESKQQEKLFIKAPNWDVARDSLDLLAIKNEQEYRQMQEAQKEMVIEAQRKKIANEKRIEEMYAIQRELHDNFISVNNFIKECEDKQQMSDKNVTQEVMLHEELEKKIKALTEDITTLEEFDKVLLEVVTELEPYETVIKEVVEEYDVFKSVKDCMDRCDALMLAQVEIAELEQEKIKEMDAMRHNLVSATNDAALLILGLNNELGEMKMKYNNARTESLKWEKIMAETKDYIAENELTRHRIEAAIRQMYTVLCKRNGVESKLLIEGQLDYIKDEIELLRGLVAICFQVGKKKQNHNHVS